MRIFGIDPGSDRTGYGCVETDGRRHTLIVCGAVCAGPRDTFPDRLARIHQELSEHLAACAPDCVAIESLFHAANVRSALKLGHARGVAVLAAVQAGCEVAEYTPAEIKRAVVGYGRAEKHQVQQMIKLLLGLAAPPSPHDAADALAVAICHAHSATPLHVRDAVATRDARGRSPARGASDSRAARPDSRSTRSWRSYRPPSAG